MKILKFYKQNCDPCDQIESNLQYVSTKFNIPIEYVDNTVLTELAAFYGITENPTIVLIDGDRWTWCSGMTIIEDDNGDKTLSPMTIENFTKYVTNFYNIEEAI